MSQGHARDALETRARKIVEQLGGTWSRSKGMCCCPAHADRTPSLSITLGKRAILVHCFAGCTNEAVMQAMARLGVRISDLFDGPSGPITIEPRGDVTDHNAFRLWLEASALAGSPREYVIDYLTKSFPVRLMAVFTDENGKARSEPMSDDSGAPVLCRSPPSPPR